MPRYSCPLVIQKRYYFNLELLANTNKQEKVPLCVFPKDTTEWREWVLNRDHVDYLMLAVNSAPHSSRRSRSAVGNIILIWFLDCVTPFGSKPTQNILKPFCCVFGKDTLWYFLLLGSLEKHLNFIHISIKFHVDSNTLASREISRGNYLPFVLEPPLLSCETGG